MERSCWKKKSEVRFVLVGDRGRGVGVAGGGRLRASGWRGRLVVGIAGGGLGWRKSFRLRRGVGMVVCAG